ncbi:hypothetical protein L1281_002570 [Neisseria sp. HSC-16F19]|nr:hypothetical protein [Neisseria sp. HSC-16F19]
MKNHPKCLLEAKFSKNHPKCPLSLYFINPKSVISTIHTCEICMFIIPIDSKYIINSTIFNFFYFHFIS